MYVLTIHFPYKEACAEHVVVEATAKRRRGDDLDVAAVAAAREDIIGLCEDSVSGEALQADDARTHLTSDASDIA